MAELCGFTYKELEEELKRRDAIAEEVRIANRPQPLREIDWSTVQQLAESYIEAVAGDDLGAQENLQAYIFESAIGAVFGANVWDWINRRLR